MERVEFGTDQHGEKAYLYTLKNKKNLAIKVSNYGSTLVSVLFPDKDGIVRDLVLGYDDAGEYERNTSYFGATIGRNCNRIDQAQMMIDGKLCKVAANENENNLHSGPNGFNRAMWEVKEYTDNSITFFHLSTEEEQGFPGNLRAEVTYTVTDEDAVEISYRGEADKTTIMNYTNHSYFNLCGHETGSAMNQELQVFAERYNTVRDSKTIPTGKTEAVEGTPMDFRTPKPIGQDIEADFDQLKHTKGYDHNYVIGDKPGVMKVFANAYCKESGIALEASTDCCGVHLYVGNYIGNQKGKGGADYVDRSGFCLETQYCPNAMNQEGVPSPIVKAGDVYTSKTVYRFYVK